MKSHPYIIKIMLEYSKQSNHHFIKNQPQKNTNKMRLRKISSANHIYEVCTEKQCGNYGCLLHFLMGKIGLLNLIRPPFKQENSR